MGSARLCVALILVTVLFKVSFGQQFSLGNTQDCRSHNVGMPPDQGTQRIFNLVSNAQSANCNSKPLTGLQQFLNYQNANNQQSSHSQPGASIQQPQNQPQSQSNIKKADFYSLPLNLQAKILQQIQQIQSGSAPNNNLQRSEQSSPLQPQMGSLPVTNGQVPGLPSQLPPGLVLSNLGLTSSFPSSTLNVCGCPLQGTEQVVVNPQSTVATVSNNVKTSPTSPAEGYFITKFIPISAIPLQDIQPQTSHIPVSLENSSGNQQQNNILQNIQHQTSYIPVSLENSSANQHQNNILQSALTDKQNMPIQFAFHPVEQVRNQVQNHQVPACIPSQPSLTDLDPQTLLTSILLSQLGGTNPPDYTQYQTGPSSYQAGALPSLPIPNQGSKSSSVKALLPLLLNMLKDKGDCGCHNNNKCGSFKDNQSNKELVSQVNQDFGIQFSGQQQQPHKSNVEPKLENNSKNVIESREQNSDKEKKDIEKKETPIPNSRINSAEDDEANDDDYYEEDDPEDETSS